MIEKFINKFLPILILSLCASNIALADTPSAGLATQPVGEAVGNAIENAVDTAMTIEVKKAPVPLRFKNKEPVYKELSVQVPVESSSVMEVGISTLDGEAPVRITPLKKITTSNPLLKEGDFVEFVVVSDVKITDNFQLNKGEKAVGMITKLVDNGFNGDVATVLIDQFEIKRESGEKYLFHGQIKKEGKNHDKAIGAYNYVLGPAAFWIRGGEVQMKPKRDTYTIYMYNLGRLEKL